MGSSATSAEVGGGERLLAFDAAGVPLACRVGSVREILPLPTLVSLPGAPPEILGVVAVRGRVLVVLDGEARWGRPAGSTAGAGMLLVVAHASRWLGVRVTAVERVAEFRTAGAVAVAPGGELFELPGTGHPPRCVVDVAVLVHSVLVDRGEMTRESDRTDL
jgi:purine-binding chemotaxis protein CheW